MYTDARCCKVSIFVGSTLRYLVAKRAQKEYNVYKLFVTLKKLPSTTFFLVVVRHKGNFYFVCCVEFLFCALFLAFSGCRAGVHFFFCALFWQ
jgi:hypothetical protein